MRRRDVLGGVGTGVSVVIAGCLGGSDSETPSETPSPGATSETPSEQSIDEAAVTAPIRALWNGFNDANREAVGGAYHPDTPHYPDRYTFEFRGTVSVEETDVVSSLTDSATVDADLTYALDGEQGSWSHTYEVRRYDGEWRVWSVLTESSGYIEPAPPDVSFSFDYEPTDGDGGVVTVTHASGGSVDAAALYVQGGRDVDTGDVTADITAYGTTWADATGAETVAAGSTVSVAVREEYTVTVFWQPPEGESSFVVGRADGEA